MKFGDKLKKLRQNNNMSQEELADKINVSRQAISKWELKETMPETDNIVQVSKIFKVSIDYLLDDNVDSEELESIPVYKDAVEKTKRNTLLTTLIISIGVFIALIVIFRIAMSFRRISVSLITFIYLFILTFIVILVIRLLLTLIKYFKNK